MSDHLSAAARDVLLCLFVHGPTIDGDVPSKSGRDELFSRGLASRENGWSYLTAGGVLQALAAGLDREKEARDRKRRALVALPPQLTDPLADALGMMNFVTGPIANLFRASGYDIPRKCEAEQAFVLHWAARLALQYGDEWRQKAAEEMRELGPAGPL